MTISLSARSTRSTIASRFAYVAAALFAVGLTISIALRPPEGFAGAPAWAQGSGYAWIVFDNVLEMLALFGEGAELIVPLRWGVHLATATWILGASWGHHGALRWLGLLVALILTGVTLAGAAFPDMQFQVEDVFGEGERVVARGRLTGTHTGPWMGQPATNRPIDIGWMAIYRFAGGKIAERWLIGDDLAMMRQLAPATT